MNSSMLAGERRWASARRGGMTVLGKVAVPKPINLPSQRLENHGLDPNVEIVPKGTVSWGSRSSSSASNPWTSSSLSPNADGGTVSPSHPSGRPSSGGSGTRPSTSGSDRTHDLVPSARGSNSRPSSASGTSSNLSSSASLRPRSAENRPNSSQLSRFAEPVSKSSTAWGSSATAERLGVKSSKEDGFSLSSGDFPTLGSEKDNLEKNIESRDNSRPSSAAGIINHAKEDTGPNADVKHGPVNTWRADGSQNPEDDINHSMDKWQGDAHHYFNSNNPPQHFEAWRGPPMNGPAGVWYGGHPRGPPFGAHVPPGGFPTEPFPYYHRPQIPPPHLAGPQPVPPAGPRGPHPKNGDLYRPQIPDAYPRPGMQFRPGFYPGPPGPLPFDGYYGPPMGYHNERDIPYMGMQAGHPVYNGYPPPNPEISNPHGRPTGRGPAGKTMTEQVEAADQWEDPYGPKRVHIMSHGESDSREGGGNREQNMQHNVSHPGKSRFPISFRKNEWGAEEDAEEPLFVNRITPRDNSSYSYEDRVHSTDSVKVKTSEGMSQLKEVNDNWMDNKSESGLAFPPVVPPNRTASERESLLPAANRNSSLMNKIDDLNAKFRVSDEWNEFPSACKGEEGNGSKIVDTKISNYTGEASKNIAGSFERTPVLRESFSNPHEVTVPSGGNLTQPIAVVSRRAYHGGHSRVDHRGKGKFNGQDVDGWRRKPINSESSGAIAASNNEYAPKTHADDPNIVGEASESLTVNPEGNVEGDSVETHDLTDIQAQRAKMRELAKQRALQLQKEEEERIKEQKAKALAKLEELNRRTLAGEAENRKAEKTQVIGDTPTEQEESQTVVGTMVAELNVEESGFNLVPGPVVAAAIDRNSNPSQAVESVEVSKKLHLETKQTGILESNESPRPMSEGSHDSSSKKGASQVNDGGFSKHKKTGYKQRQNNSLQRSVNENSTPENKYVERPSADVRPSEPSVLNASNTGVEPPAQQRRKTNRSIKTKPKLEETPVALALPPVTSDGDHGNESTDNSGSNDFLPNLESSVATMSEPDTGVQAQEVFSSVPNEETQGRVSNQWKPHHSRRLPRSQQAHRFTDKLHGNDTVVWAPVRSQNKARGPDEASQNSIQESANLTKGNNMIQNSLKGKRAEMERYVPKPVAKELAQQGNVPPSSVSSSRSNEGAGWEQSALVSSASPHFGSSVEINEGDRSHNKHKRDHGTWKQRGSTDSSHMKGVHVGTPPTSEPATGIEQSMELVQSVRSEINAAHTDTKLAVKDQGATGIGKRHPQRGLRSRGKNPDSENILSGEIDESSAQSVASDVKQTDRDVVSKENRSIGERTSHWQPKGGPNSANYHQGSRTAGSEFVTTEISRTAKKDHTQNKQSGNSSQTQPDQSANVKINVAQESVVGHQQELDLEKKPGPVKGRPYSPSQDPVGSGEPNTNTGDQFERSAASGSRRNVRHNNRPIRGHDSRGDWSSGHDNRPAFRERPRQNMHYEYQPVGPVKGNKPEKFEEPADGGADSRDQRYRDRGQSHPKRGGNFYRRQSEIRY